MHARLQEFRTRTDYAHRTVFNADSLNLWVSFRCDFYGSIMLLAICALAVGEKDRGSAVVGLAFSNTIQLLVFYTWTLRLITEAVALAGSVEQLTWLAKSTPIDGQDDVNNAGQALSSAPPRMLHCDVMCCCELPRRNLLWDVVLQGTVAAPGIPADWSGCTSA